MDGDLNESFFDLDQKGAIQKVVDEINGEIGGWEVDESVFFLMTRTTPTRISWTLIEPTERWKMPLL